ncbi:hypothetical protein [Evansella tamaricis]|uniref:Uncharacterized protein n=1 Tax=Evansella tamaricis TaxID=2069301 RepID=A0ABS6JF56_9BACI|nr:hypothetical protein [Evansella tamaricis]MBU9711849.1 hypothetical protein [Evansella tamaricis]
MIRKKWNKYPYIVLFIIHFILLLFTFTKANNRKSLVVLLFSNMGIAYLFEYIVLSFLHLYRYKPEFFRKNFLDEISGAILSQAVYVPFTALFITAFKLNWIVKLGFAVYFMLIQKLFIKMGIFKERGWKTRYTLILIYLYFHISDQWLRFLEKGNSFIQKLTLYNMVQFTCINLLVALEMMHKLTFGRGYYHSLMEQHKMETSYASLMSVLKTWVTYIGNIKAKALVVVGKIVVDYILKKSRLIKIKSLIPITIVDILVISLAPLYKKWIGDAALYSDSTNK